MGRIYRLGVPALAAVLVFTLGAALPSQAEIKIGQKLPPIAGRNLAGDKVVLEDYYKSGVVVVAFWSIYCKPCVAEISSLIRLQDRYKDRATVIGINTDGELPVPRVRSFVEHYEEFEKKKISYPIIFDEHNVISKQLGVGFLPMVLAVDSAGTVIDSYVGFEEKEEAEIFQGIERLLPGTKGQSILADETMIFDAESMVPACGFYDETGWKESFYGNQDITKELDRVARVAREMALKNALKKALERLGLTLCEKDTNNDCFKPYGVLLQNDPWKERDCLTNLLNALDFRKYSEVKETNERWLGTSYWVQQKVSVNLSRLRDDLERMNFSLKPISVTFVVVNMGRMERLKFEDAIMSQSKFIGKTDFPAYTVYTSQENFIRELDKLDYAGTKIFVNDAGSGVIEVEVWR